MLRLYGEAKNNLLWLSDDNMNGQGYGYEEGQI